MPQRRTTRVAVSKPTLETLFDRFGSYPIYSALCHIIPLQSLLALSATSRFFLDSLLAQWNIDQSLSRFVSNPKRFRSQLGAYDALVSGSFALQFFERVVWSDSDLDVFIHEKHIDAFAGYLVSEEGYTHPVTTPPAQIREQYAMPDLIMIQNMYRQRPGTSIREKVQLIAVHRTPCKAILGGFYSTTVVNFISWNRAYSIFPKSTLLQHKGYLLRPLDDFISTFLTKYARRGYKFQETLWQEEEIDSHPVQKTRRIGDHHSWVMLLDTAGVIPATTPDTALLFSEFRMHEGVYDATTRRARNAWYEVSASTFSSPVLRGRYSCAPFHCLLSLGPRLDTLTKIEMQKIEVCERPYWWRDALNNPNGMHSYKEDFEKLKLPDEWTYYDDEIPGWYHHQEQKFPPEPWRTS